MRKLYIPLNIQRFAASGSISCTTTYQDYNANTSNVRITFTVTRTSGSTYWSDPKTATITCEGNTATTTITLPRNVTSNSCYVDFNNIQHAADGTKSISFSASVATGTGAGTITASGSATLPAIPRGFSGPIGLSLVSVTETSATFNWSTSETCNWVRYHFDNSAGWHDVFSGSATSGQFTVYNGDSLYGGGNVNITAASSHNVYIECRRQDSGQWGNSGNAGFTSADYPKPLNVSSNAIDNGFTINVYNPLGRLYTLDLLSNETSPASVVGTYTGRFNGNLYGFNDASTINAFYQTIPNKPSGTYYARLTCNETSTTRTSPSGTYKSANNSDSQPIMPQVGYVDINSSTLSLTGDNQKLIPDYSTIQVTIPANGKATGQRYATVTKYKLSSGDYTSGEIDDVEGEDVVLTCTASNGIIVVEAIDSRGESGKYQITDPTIVGYTPIEKNQNPSAVRTDDQGDPNGVGEYVKISLSGKYWNQSFGSVTNSIQNITYNYANAKTPDQTTTGTTTITSISSNDTYSVAQLILGDTPQGFNVANSYVINVTVSDYLSSTTFTMIVSGGTPHICYDENGIGIMKKFDQSNSAILQVDGGIDGSDYNLNNSKTLWLDNGVKKVDKDTQISDVNVPLNNLTTYSTSEQLVGKWIDNRNLYRVVITGSSSTKTDHAITGNIISAYNIRDLVSFQYAVKDSQGRRMASYYVTNGVNDNDYLNAWVEWNDGCIHMRSGNTYPVQPLNYYFIIMYTKN